MDNASKELCKEPDTRYYCLKKKKKVLKVALKMKSLQNVIDFFNL